MSAGDALERLRRALEDNGCEVRGNNARCPAHDDRQASLSIGQGRLGALINCHANCETDMVLEALGLSAADLFDEPPEAEQRHQPGGFVIVATYTYTDEAGLPLFYVERRQPKDFRQYRLDGGEKVWRLGRMRRPLYRLPEVLAAVAAGRTVYVTEGEKDADAIVAAGGVATTNAGGAGKWRAEHTKALRGADVIVWQDADARGRAHGATIAAALTGAAAAVRVVEAAEGKDAYDHLRAGLGLDDAVEPADVAEPSPEAAQRSTDAGYALRLLAAHGADMRYVGPWKCWLVWDGQRWRRDDTGQVHDWAVAVARDVTDATDPRDLAPYAAAVRREAEPRVRGSIEIAKSDQRVAILPTDLDSQWWLLNTASGTVDLRTMALRPHDRADLITKVTRGRFTPGATAGEWDKFLAEVQPDEAMRSYLARLTGLALEGRVIEHILPVHYGEGGNGKTTFFEAVAWALGDYSISVDVEMLLLRHNEATATGIADLFGSRLVVAREAEANRRLAEATVKALTGGDQITARRLYENHFTFTPSHTFALFTNNRPVIAGRDRGIWRRLRLVPWTVEIDKATEDGELGHRLHDAADAVLAWLLAGYVDWRDNRLAEPAAVREATEGWQRESDTVARFLDERTTAGEHDAVKSAQLHAAYLSWAEEERIRRPMNQKQFTQALLSKGFESVRERDGVWLLGVDIRREEENAQVNSDDDPF